jgi:hypothetical protein
LGSVLIPHTIGPLTREYRTILTHYTVTLIECLQRGLSHDDR